MAITNRERVGKGLELLGTGLSAYVERELKATLSDRWQESLADGPARPAPKKKGPLINLADPQILLGAIWNHWNDVFNKTLGHAERSLVSEIRDVRNRWAHNEAFSGNDAHRALDSISRLLAAASAEQANEVEQMRMDLMRVQFEEQRRSEMRKSSFQPTDGKPQGGAVVLARSRDATSRRFIRAVPEGRVRGRSVAGLPE